MTRRVYSIAPHVPFLETLVARILDGTLLGDWPRNGPFWLSDVTIILPTQRARQALADAFGRAGQALLPDIRTLGGDVAEEEPFLPPFDTPLPPAVSTMERRLVLSHLVGAWARSPDGSQAFATPPTPGEILAMAESLGTLIDDLTIEGVPPEALRAIAPGTEAEGGHYWQQTLRFLEIALTAWPARLQVNGQTDPASLRNLRLQRQADALKVLHGDRPVIAAGSTGSIPATAVLLAAIADLQRGCLVLPGFDTAATPDYFTHLLDPKSAGHGHPQYGMARLIGALGIATTAIVELAASSHPRTNLVNLALAPTRETAHWSRHRLDAEGLATATDGVSVIAAHTEQDEARAIALAARAALAECRTVGIITPDRNLARRIAAELARFEIFVDDAAGTPLFQSAAGRLMRQALTLAANELAAVDLVALLRNRAVSLGRARPDLSRLTDDVDHGLLRGQRPGPGFAGLHRALAANVSKATKHPARRLDDQSAAAITALIDDLEAAMAPLMAVLARSTITSPDLVSALHQTVIALNQGGQPVSGMREAAQWVADLAASADTGFSYRPAGLDGVLFALMSGVQVRDRAERRRDIAIWGQLEARQQSPDLLILGALNEDKWPETADPGPWLSRGMRIAAGLDPPERQQGLAAHDFAQALGNGQVILAFSERIGSSPALPSRLLQRLEAFAGEACAKNLREKGAVWLDRARRLDAAAAIVPARAPQPNPPVRTRPTKLSVTEIETLMRSPYDIYARHVLKLLPIDALGAVPDARDRGTIIHAVFARFVLEGHDSDATDATKILRAMADEAFAGLDAIGERRDIWLRRFYHAADLFLAFERAREHRVKNRLAEIDGRWALKLASPFTLTGRADRVDQMNDGTLELIDFKTGGVPIASQMRDFQAPQLLLEAAMAEAGAFADLLPAETSALTYIKIGFGPSAFQLKGFAVPAGWTIMDAAREAANRMQRHVEHFLMRPVPMPARLVPLANQRFAGTYDHLARTAEWTLLDRGEDEF